MSAENLIRIHCREGLELFNNIHSIPKFPKSDKEDSLEGMVKIIVDSYGKEYRKEERNRLRHSNAIMGLEVNE